MPKLSIDGVTLECGICCDVFKDPVRLECDHYFCASCWDKCKRHQGNVCPVCKTRVLNITANPLLMRELLQKVPVAQPCGQQVAPLHQEQHEKTCTACLCAHMELLKTQLHQCQTALATQEANAAHATRKLRQLQKQMEVVAERAELAEGTLDQIVARRRRAAHFAERRQRRAARQQRHETQQAPIQRRRQCLCADCTTGWLV